MPRVRWGRVAPTAVSWPASNIARNRLDGSWLVGVSLPGIAGSTTLSSSGGPLPGTGYVRVTATGSTIAAGGDIVLLGDTSFVAGSGATLAAEFPASPGVPYSWSVYVRCSKAVTVRPQSQPILGGAGGTVSAVGTGADVALVANTWTRLSIVGTVLATGQALRCDVDCGSAASITWAAGDTLDVACLQANEGAVLLPWCPVFQV